MAFIPGSAGPEERHRAPGLQVEVLDQAGVWRHIGQTWSVAGASLLELEIRRESPGARIRVVTASGRVCWDTGAGDDAA